MMEVKQNTTMDLNQLKVQSIDNETDDIPLEHNIDSELLTITSENLKENELSKNGISNGKTNDTVSDIDIDSGLDALTEPIRPELEEALLAEDDEPASVVDKVITEDVPKTISEDKVETSSTASSEKLRDVGDDLDTLLSKINDIVEDCKEPQTATENQVTFTAETVVDDVEMTEEIKEAKEVDSSENVQNDVNVEMKSNETVINYLDENMKVDNVEKASQSEADDNNDANKQIDETSNKSSKPTVDKVNNQNSIATEEFAESAAIQESQTVKEDESEKNSVEQQISKDAGKVTETVAESDDDEVTAIENEIPTLTVDDDDEEELIASEKNADINATDNSCDEKKPSEQETQLHTDKDTETGQSTQPEDDSDDDVVFFLEKAPEDKSNKKIETEEKSPQKMGDDDVVLLDDDDEDEQTENVKEHSQVTLPEINELKSADTAEVSGEQKKDEALSEISKKDVSEKAASDETQKQSEISLLSDNSDNARDDFVRTELAKDSSTESTTVKSAKNTTDVDETASNCSSSSNLLQEAKPSSTADDEAVDDPEMEEDEDADGEGDGDGDADDVELIEDVVVETPSEETSKDACDAKLDSEENTKESSPPAKRMRLSEESEVNETVNVEDKSDDALEMTNKSSDIEKSISESNKDISSVISSSVAVKRSHEALTENLDSQKSESAEISQEEVAMKKPKTESVETCKKEDISQDSSEDVGKVVTKAEPEDLKIDYKLKAFPSTEPVPLYPPPKFADNVPSFNIEFFKRFQKSCSSLTKIDLEELVLQKIVEVIVHKSEFAEMREVIEKQEKIINSHRARITELSKQFRDLEMVHNRVLRDIEQKNSQFVMPVKITRAVGLQVYIPNKKGGINDPLPAAIATSTATSSSQLVRGSPQRPTPQTSPMRSQVVPTAADSSTTSSFARMGAGPLPTVASAAAALNSRKKITPQRPMDSNSAYRNPSVAQTGNSPMLPSGSSKVLNKTPNTSTLPTQRRSFPAPASAAVQMQQQMAARQQLGSANAGPRRFNSNNVPPSKMPLNNSSSTQQPQFRTQNKSAVDSYLNSLPAGGSVSITPAKPKDKSFIDLTDEDDAPQQQPQATLASNSNPAQRPRTAGVSPSTNNAAYLAQQQQQRNAMTRISPAAVAANKQRGVGATNKSTSNASAMPMYPPPGTSITRVHVGSNSSANAPAPNRMKLGHPAPLPTAPPQPYNATWKLPPPRPTIRISNLENGIVISWTMEEAMDRHADCVSYQIYAYQETTGAPSVDSWRHVGDVKAMLLPMAVTLTQFQEGQRYYFAVRAVDGHQRYGPFSLPKTWS